MKAQQLLDNLAATMGLPALPLNGDQCARLVFDTKIAVDFESDPISGELFLYCDLGTLPLGGREALYRRLLEANLFGQQTLRATLAIEGSSDMVVLWRAVLCEELSLEAFQKVVEDFVNCAESWIELMAKGGPGTDTPASRDPGGLPPPAMGGYMQV